MNKELKINPFQKEWDNVNEYESITAIEHDHKEYMEDVEYLRKNMMKYLKQVPDHLKSNWVGRSEPTNLFRDEPTPKPKETLAEKMAKDYGPSEREGFEAWEAIRFGNHLIRQMV